MAKEVKPKTKMRKTMTITLRLPADTELRLKEKATQNGQTLEDYLEKLIEREAQTGNGTRAVTESAALELTATQWSSEWRAWAAGHRTLPTCADDSRESIYGDRGL